MCYTSLSDEDVTEKNQEGAGPVCSLRFESTINLVYKKPKQSSESFVFELFLLALFVLELFVLKVFVLKLFVLELISCYKTGFRFTMS